MTRLPGSPGRRIAQDRAAGRRVPTPSPGLPQMRRNHVWKPPRGSPSGMLRAVSAGRALHACRRLPSQQATGPANRRRPVQSVDRPSEVRVLDRAAAAKTAVEPPRNHRRETDWEVIMVGSLHFVAREGATAAGDRLGRAARASIDAGGRSNPEITARPAPMSIRPQTSGDDGPCLGGSGHPLAARMFSLS